jgi:hypothetical protein
MSTLISPNNMTSDTAPSPYVASADSGTAWNAFSGTPADWWVSSGVPGWLQIDLGAAASVASYSFQSSGTGAPGTWTLEGSPDGSTWTVLDTQTGVTGFIGASRYYALATAAAFRYWRLNISASGGYSQLFVALFSLYSTVIVDFAPHTLTSDTSDPPYVVSAVTARGGNPEWLAFGGTPSNAFISTAVPCSLQLDTGASNSYVLSSYAIASGYDIGDAGAPTAWTLEGSHNGSTWTTLDTQTGITTFGYPGDTATYAIAGSPAPYRYFQINVTATKGGAFAEVGQLYLYGTAAGAPPPPTQRGNIAYDQIKASDRTGNGDQLMTWNNPFPATPTSPGAAGQTAYDSSGNLYWCFAANTWARIGPGGYSTTW